MAFEGNKLPLAARYWDFWILGSYPWVVPVSWQPRKNPFQSVDVCPTAKMENTHVQPYFVTNQVTHQLHVPMCKSQGIQRKTPLKTCRWSKPVVPKNHGVYAVHLRRMYIDIFICFSP